jgi:hypothetical protein
LLGTADPALELVKRLDGLRLVRVLFLLPLLIVRVGVDGLKAGEDRRRRDDLRLRGEGVLDVTELLEELFRGGENELEGEM